MNVLNASKSIFTGAAIRRPAASGRRCTTPFSPTRKRSGARSRLDPISRPRAMSSRGFGRAVFAERILTRRKFRESRFGHGVGAVSQRRSTPRNMPAEWSAKGDHLKPSSRFSEICFSRISGGPPIMEYRTKRLNEPIMRRGKPALINGATKKVSFSTVNRELAFLRFLLNLAEDDGLIEQGPKFKW